MDHQLSVGYSMWKKKKNVDRISLLPDSLLHDIFSSLNTQQVVQTCVLSKRWKTVWTHIPTLNFNYKSYLFKGKTSRNETATQISFYQFVTEVLSEYRGSHIIKLSYSHQHFACIDEEEIPKYPIESLISFAASHMVQELSINAYSSEFDWTRSLSACQSLTVLEFSSFIGCGYHEKSVNGGCDKGGVLMLPLLRTLKLGEFCWDYLQENVFSGCPVLESLILVDFECFGRTTICAPKLENFEVRSYPYDDDNRMEIVLRTPNLRCVKFYNILPIVKSALDFPCIDKVTIGVSSYYLNYHHYYEDCNLSIRGREAVELLRLFHNARTISMPLRVTEGILSVPTTNLSFHNLRHLKLEAFNTTKRIDFPMNKLQCLLKCPTLETMVLDLIDENRDD